MISRGTFRSAVGSTAAVALVSLGAVTVPAHAAQRLEHPGPRIDRDISVERFARNVRANRVLGHLDELQDIADANGGNRASGLPGYDASVAYLVGELEDAGYHPVVQTFEFPFYEETASAFSQVAPAAVDYVEATDFDLFEYSGSADVQAQVVPVDLALDPPRASTSGCEPSDFLGPEEQSLVTGRIALVQRGACAFGQKIANAEAAGAVAVVVMNQGNEDPDDDRFGVFSGTLGGPAGIPAVAVGFERGAELAATEGLVLRVLAETETGTRTTSNVIAETHRGDPGTVVMAGAHLDSVQEGAGINDNGTGSAALLEIAVQLARQHVAHDNAVRFAWWGAEESGLLGSTNYVAALSEEERERIALYLNFDMIGSPNHVFGIYDGDNSGGTAAEGTIPAGSAQIEDLFESLFTERGEPFGDSEFSGRSDYGPFIEVGIPAGGLFTGAEGVKTEAEAAVFGGVAGAAYDPCYHEACDNLGGDLRDEAQQAVFDQIGDRRVLAGNVNRHALEVNTSVIASAILTLARDASPVTTAP